MDAHQGIVARAAGHSLGIDEAAELVVAGTPQAISLSTRSVDRVVSLWIDYTLLALEFASPDSFSDVEVSSLTREPVTQQVISKLHEAVVVPRVDPTEEEVRAAYELEQPFARARVQQIFISTSGARESQIDSLARLAESIRERAAAGADFRQLARRYSQNPPFAFRDASMGWVSRGRVVSELEPIIFSLQAGEVSEAVRTNFGFHVFKVTATQSPQYESVKDRYWSSYRERRIWEEWGAFEDSLLEAADVRLAAGALDLVRQTAAEPGLEPFGSTRRAAPLMHYVGGVLTVGDWIEAMTATAPAPLRFFATMDSASLHTELEQMVRDRLLMGAAEALGHTLSDAEYAGIREDAYGALRRAADRAGFRREELLGSEEAITTAVERAIGAVGSNGQLNFQLGRLAIALRQGRNVRVYPDRFPAVLEKVEALRAGHQESSP